MKDVIKLLNVEAQRQVNHKDKTTSTLSKS